MFCLTYVTWFLDMSLKSFKSKSTFFAFSSVWKMCEMAKYSLRHLRLIPTFTCRLSPHHDSPRGLVTLSVNPSCVFPIRERASGAPVAAVSTAVLPGRGFHLPATSPGPRGLGGALHPGVRSRRCILVSGRPADVEGHGWNYRHTHFPVHCDGRV